MRLTETQITIITKLFKQHFLETDHLWLFGSRVDNTKKGGDIDLYIETENNDVSDIYSRERKFWSAMQTTLGEQKIDIVVNRIRGDFHILIYKIARETGVKLV